MAKILIIEDTIEVLEMITLVLNTYGYEVVGATETVEINTIIKEHNPHLVLLDVVLGHNISGRDICQTIKNLRPDIPIILMSADTKQLDDYHACHADDTLEKPFDLILLRNKIDKLLTVYRMESTGN